MSEITSKERTVIANKGKPKIFYGWWVVFSSTMALCLSGGFYFYGFSTYFMPLVEEFGWSRASTSGAFALSRMEGGILGPAGGFLVDRFGPRRIMFFGIAIMGAGFILLSRIDSLLTFYLAYVLGIAVGSTLGIHQSAHVAVANWFQKKRGTAIGIASSGIGMGGLIVPFLGWLIARYGWRQAAIISGIAVWIIGLTAASIMKRYHPEHYGYLPDGGTKETNLTSEPEVNSLSSATITKDKVSPVEIDFTPRQALRTTTFWLLALIFGLRQFVMSAVVVHQIPFLVGIGIAPELAATMLGGLALISIAGRLGFGRLADVMDKRHVMAICLGFTGLGCFILANANTFWQVVIFLIVYSPAYGGGAVLMNTIRGEYFGRRHYGTIMGSMDLVQTFGVVSGPIFAGWIFDVRESYQMAFMTFAIVAAVATGLMLVVRRPVLAPEK